VPTARSVNMNFAPSLAAADPIESPLQFVPHRMVVRILADLNYVFRRRIHTPVVTVWTTVQQALDNGSQRKAVAAMMAARRAKGWITGSHDPSAYCSARQRFRLNFLLRLVDAVAAWLRKAARPHFWYGRRVLLVDGSTVSMPDTPDLTSNGFAQKLAELSCRRWEVEGNLDHLKTTLGMDVLSAESPQMVIKEVWAHFLVRARHAVPILLLRA